MSRQLPLVEMFLQLFMDGDSVNFLQPFSCYVFFHRHSFKANIKNLYGFTNIRISRGKFMGKLSSDAKTLQARRDEIKTVLKSMIFHQSLSA